MAKSLLTNKSWFDRNQTFINVLLHNILDTIGCKHPPAKENVLNLVLVELSILSFNMICRVIKDLLCNFFIRDEVAYDYVSLLIQGVRGYYCKL